MEKLAENEVHLWFCDTLEPCNPTLAERYQNLLSDDERKRMERLRTPEHRLHFLRSRSFLRVVLSRYADIEPELLVFGENPYGKPHLLPKNDSRPFCFNLSNTKGHFLCSVTRQGEIGADIERIDRRLHRDDVGERFFSASECLLLRNCKSEEEKRELFFRFWTLKEAYIKAKGLGLSLPLRLFSFSFPKEDKIAIRFEPELADTEKDWRFALFSHASVCRATCAFQSTFPQESIRYRGFNAVPFLLEEEISLNLLAST